MSSILHLHTFGGLTLHYEGQIVTGLASRKMEALMVYLALTHHQHAREHLADLFWSDAPLDQALGNLRVMLTRLRKVFPHHLAITRQTVGIDSGATIETDAEKLSKILESGLARWWASTKLLPDEVGQMEHALTLYQGAFLAGVSLKGAGGFDTWVDSERQRLSRLMLDGGQALIGLYQQQKSHAKILRIAQKLLTIDPFSEPLHALLMETHWQLDQRGQALAQYEVLSNTLQRELDVEPSANTQALAERIRTSEAPKTVSVARPNYLPNEPSLFIGREREMGEIVDIMSQSHCRLLTLLGIGGTGKTRLAIATAKTLAPNFPDGVYFVGLETVESPNLIISAIVSALHLDISALQTHKQLINYLASRQILLILDNFEHLCESATVLTDILKDAPTIKLLVTSRERLNLQEEWVYDVNGLDCPESISALETSDAARLLISASRQIGVRLSPHNGDASTLLNLCRLVDGLPLALEMSAALLRDNRPTELLEQLQNGLDTLKSSLRNIPERQRSLRALFDYTWGRLPDSERIILAKLSVFHGSFNTYAAASIAGAQVNALDRLRARALIQPVSEQRYTLHPVIRQYAAEALAQRTDDHERTHNQHAEFFCTLLFEQYPVLLTAEFRPASDTLLFDEDNLVATWSWCLQNRHVAQMMEMLAPLEQWFLLRSHYTYAVTFMDNAHKALPDSPEFAHARAWLFLSVFRFKYMLRQQEIRQDLIDHALDVFTEVGDLRGQAYLSRMIGAQVGALQGKHQDSLTWLEKSLTLYAQCEDRDGYTTALLHKATFMGAMGHFDDAQAILQEAFENRTQNPVVIPDIYWQFGMFKFYQEKFEDSLYYYEQALEFDRAYGFDGHYAKVLLIYGTSLMCIERYKESDQAFRQALTFYQDIGHRAFIASSYERLAELSMRQRQYTEGLENYKKSIDNARKSGIIQSVMDMLTNFGNTCVSQQVFLEEGKAALLESLQLARQHSYQKIILRSLFVLSDLLVSLGEFDDIPMYLAEAVELATRTSSPRQLMEVYLVLAKYTQVIGMNNLAYRAAQIVATHHSTAELTRQYAHNILAHLTNTTASHEDDPALVALLDAMLSAP